MKRNVRKIIKDLLSLKESKSLYFNEAVNFETRTIFVAIPKTGTTSIRSQLRQEGTPLIRNPHLNIIQIRDSLYVYLLKKTLGTNQNFPSELVPRDAQLRAKANEIFKTFFKFSAVRNPWARAVSLYYRREGVLVKDKISFEEFCNNHFYASDTCRQPTLHKNQIDWLCDENGKIIMDYVYKLEEFDSAIKEIEERTNGRLILSRKKSNNNPDSRSNAYRNMYTKKTKRIVASRFKKDIDYFKYTF